MMIQKGRLRIYFGDASDGITEGICHQISSHDELYAVPACARLQRTHHLEQLVFIDQVHGIEGFHLQEMHVAQQHVPFGQVADYSTTSLLRCGIGILTADCVPVVLYDETCGVVAVVHAGWRGAVAGIVEQVLCAMNSLYGTQMAHVRVWIGPSARGCCYEVGQEVIDAVSIYSCAKAVVEKKGATWFFDVGAFVWHELQKHGVLASHIVTSYNVCTICSTTYCSYRREKAQAGRQMTVAWMV